MSKIKSYIPVIISFLISVIIIFVYVLCTKNDVSFSTKEYYNVYLDGKLLGSIRSKVALENYINKEQKNLKKQYGVSKIYVPNGIDIEKGISHEPEIVSEKKIYNKIKKKKGFTVKGYVVTITDSKKNEIKINMIDKKIFNKAVTKVVKSFVDQTSLNNYRNNTQPEIKTTGSIIENIDIEQDVSIKESYISTEEPIYLDTESLTKYLLFGSSSTESEYIVKPGDTIETVAFNNKLNEEEFLIVNPEFTSSNNLLTPGQVVNVALINPVLKIVVEKHIVVDQDKPFEIEEKDDDSMDVGTTEVEVEGVNGRQRLTEKIKYVNGDIEKSVIVNTEVLKEPIKKVVRKGTRKSYNAYSYYEGGGSPAVVSGVWGWPTIYPYIITSEFKFRWGRHHNGLDISGCGFGSPIFSIGDGTVVDVVASCPGQGYYGSSCGSGYGNRVQIQTGNMLVIYAHLNSVQVSVGQHVSKGEVVGTMGNSGSSTGTHLHFEVRVDGTPVNPWVIY